MARKKKALKDLKEHKNNTTIATTTIKQPLQDHSAPITPKKRNSFDEHMLQTQQQQQQQKYTQYQSDGELMELKQKLNLEKNKSNLFLIKSYSFIDKTNNKRPSKQLNVKEKLQEFDKFKQSQLSEQNGEREEGNGKSKKSAKSSKQIQKGEEKKEKPKKPPKLKKMKKSKSTYDSTENLEDFREILRKPSVILEDEVKGEEVKRPQSLPVAQNQHKTVIKSKTLDDIETPRLKRDSFIRHSLQSIRRSFSSSKKHNNNISITSSSSSSSSSSSGCSNSSTASDFLRKSKTKDSNKDIGNLKDVEDSNYLIAVEEEDCVEDVVCQSPGCNVVITLNDAQTLEQIPEYSKETSCSSQTPAANSSSYTMDSLAVLKEEDEKDLCSCFNPDNGASCSSSSPQPSPSVQNEPSSLAQLPTDSSSLSPMAPLQTHTECLSVQCLNTLDQDYKSNTNNNNNNNTATSSSSSSSPPQQTKTKRIFQQQLSIPESLQSTSIGCATSSEYSSARSLKHSATSLTPLPSLNTSGSLRSISPSRRSASSSNSSSTAKHEQSTTAAAAAAAAAANATTSNGSTVTMTTSGATPASAATTPPDKEKKRKEISSSRVKKFHRHFAQVSKDEKLINYFSCALVSDILLQGHLYITDQHFAFYSNVFGYVTKVVIPTSSVTKISKEKTAKIIPNAVGVATADERHVFGSFISREAAFRLMCSVCPPLGVPEILPKDPANIEISEEYSIEDDSSCSISGNESPAQITELQQANNGGGVKLLQTNDTTTSQTAALLRRSAASSNLSIADLNRHSDIPINAKSTITANTASTRCSAPAATGEHYKNMNNSNGMGAVNLIGLKSVLQQQPALKPTTDNGEVTTTNNNNKLTIIAGCASSTTSATSTPTPSTSSSPTTVMTSSALSPASSKAKRVLNTFTSVSQQLLKHVKFPTEIHVVYLGVMLTLLLALFSIFLLYRILDIEAKTSGYRSPVEFNWRSGNDDDIFTEALRFQKQLQLKSTEEAQNILKTNLEQIAKVRRSLETLSMLIHDRSSSFVSTHTDDSD